MAKRIGILTGGGDCPGLNPAIRGVVLKALALGYECVGIQEGWKGMIAANAKPLSLLFIMLLPRVPRGWLRRNRSVLRTDRDWACP